MGKSSIILKTVLLIPAVFAICTLLAAESNYQLVKVPGVEVLRAKIGTGPDDFCPSNSDGPASFVLGKNGEIYVLDQENMRIQVFKNNKRIKMIAFNIPRTYFVDIALMLDGRIVLLDNTLKKTIYLIGEDGKAIRDYGLAGPDIANPASVHGIYVVNLDCDLDGVWAHSGGYNQHLLTRLADIKGNPDPDRIGLIGRFTYTYDRMMEAEVAGDFTVEVCAHDLRTTKASYTETSVMHDLFVDHIIGFDADRAGNFYLVTSTLEESIKNNKRTFIAQNIATIINRNGVIEKQFEVFLQNASQYVFMPIRVSEDGKLYYMALDDKGLVILMYDPWK